MQHSKISYSSTLYTVYFTLDFSKTTNKPFYFSIKFIIIIIIKLFVLILTLMHDIIHKHLEYAHNVKFP